MGALNLVTGPTEYPITLEEVKEHLRVDTNDFDAEIQSLIDEGTKYIEDSTGHKLITQTWTYKLDQFSDVIKIPFYPLSSVSSITYLDDNNASQTLSTGYYVVDSSSKPGRITQAYNQSYPTTYPTTNAVTITFVCGFGDALDTPERFKRAIKLYIQYMFDMDKLAGDIADRLIQQEKIPWLSLEG